MGYSQNLMPKLRNICMGLRAMYARAWFLHTEDGLHGLMTLTV